MIKHDIEGHTIPFRNAIEPIRFLPRGNVIRVMYTLAFLTGCRLCELDRMIPSMLFDNWIYWFPGKRQTDFRKEKLPGWFLEELKLYRRHNRVPEDKFFGISHDSFRRYFNLYVRPKISIGWREKRIVGFQSHGKFKTEYAFQLKGLRHNFQSVKFREELDKWKDAHVALEFTSKRMRHSSHRMTVYHYISGDVLKGDLESHARAASEQLCLFDFVKEERKVLEINDLRVRIK